MFCTRDIHFCTQKDEVMKFLCYRHAKEKPVTIGVMFDGDENIYPISLYDLDYTSMIDLVRNITPAEKERLAGMPKPQYGFVPLDEVVKLSPIPAPAQDIICLGINYMEHAEESARYKKEVFANQRPHAVYFSKRVNEPVPDGGNVNGHFNIVDSLDYEAELAIILGKDAFQVRAEDAFEYIFGYTILNDISARNLQTRHSQWYFGKSLDTFCPLGPCIVTADSFDFEPKLAIRSYVNGELRQNSNTANMIFGISHIIEELSAGMCLKAGTIISTGTPAGVGMGFTPPKFLKAGDVVTCEIEGIGTLTNTIV